MKIEPAGWVRKGWRKTLGDVILIRTRSDMSVYYEPLYTADALDALREENERLRRELEAAQRDAAIGAVVWKFIDRMGDVCDVDPAEKIIDEFVAAVMPAIDAALREENETLNDIIRIHGEEINRLREELAARSDE